MTFGLTDDGLVIPTQFVIRENLNVVIRDTFGASVDLGDKSAIGQYTGILSDRLASLWQALEAVHSSQNPDKATLAALDGLCLLTGTFRPAASYSAVTLTLTGTPTTVVATGSKVSTESTEQVFQTLADATITATVAWVNTTAYAVGDRRTNSSRVYECITLGVSAGSGGPTTTAADITDGTVHWIYLGEGTGDIDVEARAEETGVVVALAGDLTTIETSVGGWSSSTNLLDANPGRAVATDAELRILREQQLATGGNATLSALRAEILEVEDVTAVTVFQNVTDSVDADGLPPHSVEVLVRGGEDQDIWDALLAGVAAGIRTFGGEDGTSTDDEGTVHDVSFSRPEEIFVYATLVVTYDADLYPADGDDQIKALIVDFGDRQATGKNVVASSLTAQAFLVAGVLDVSSCLISEAPTTVPVASTTIAFSLRQLAVFDTSRVTITSSAGVP